MNNLNSGALIHSDEGTKKKGEVKNRDVRRSIQKPMIERGDEDGRIDSGSGRKSF